jgi:hypothetical protein
MFVELHAYPCVENIGPPGVSRTLARRIARLAWAHESCRTSSGETSTPATFTCSEHLVQSVIGEGGAAPDRAHEHRHDGRAQYQSRQRPTFDRHWSGDSDCDACGDSWWLLDDGLSTLREQRSEG